MKLLMVANVKFPPVTGDAVHFLDLIRHFQKNHADVSVILPKPSRNYLNRPRGVTYSFYREYTLHFIGPILSIFSMMLTVLRVSLNDKFDGIYLRQASFFFILRLIGWMLSLPIFFEINGICFLESKLRGENSLISGLHALMDKTAVKRAKGVICVSSALFNYVRKFRDDERNILKTANGVNIDMFVKDYDEDKVKRKYGLNDEVILIFIGHLTPWYDFDLLLNAMKIISSKRSDVKLLVIGEGILEGELKLKVSKMNLKNVIITGKIPHDDIPPLLKIAKIALLPLKNILHNMFIDTPLKILEYFAAGKAVIASDIGGISKTIKNNYNGVLLSQINGKELAESIVKLLGEPAKMRSLGEKAKKICCEKYSWDIVSKQILEFIGGILQDKNV